MKIYWLSVCLVKAIHQEQIAEHGGLNGIRDIGLLESALTRSQNLYWYNQVIDIPSLASAYTFAIVKNHPFVDGNKRTGFIAGVTFLLLNDYQFQHSEVEVVRVIRDLASGNLKEEQLQQWFQ